jgi:hypothetical protein
MQKSWQQLFAGIPRHFSVGEQNAKIKCGKKYGHKNAARASHPSRILRGFLLGGMTLQPGSARRSAAFAKARCRIP